MEASDLVLTTMLPAGVSSGFMRAGVFSGSGCGTGQIPELEDLFPQARVSQDLQRLGSRLREVLNRVYGPWRKHCKYLYGFLPRLIESHRRNDNVSTGDRALQSARNQIRLPLSEGDLLQVSLIVGGADLVAKAMAMACKSGLVDLRSQLVISSGWRKDSFPAKGLPSTGHVAGKDGSDAKGDSGRVLKMSTIEGLCNDQSMLQVPNYPKSFRIRGLVFNYFPKGTSFDPSAPSKGHNSEENSAPPT
ncbi:hypothetical protein NE237_020517 [Protea cynaroides]|uniref:Uncharacterized protein n=1 Tax=Protea cynaroides TaxID=273540 RepID=A0A9Q0H685_9MAGN|nr:hypothetical protein NE237_020517 [Protea cynaroides]